MRLLPFATSTVVSPAVHVKKVPNVASEDPLLAVARIVTSMALMLKVTTVLPTLLLSTNAPIIMPMPTHRIACRVANSKAEPRQKGILLIGAVLKISIGTTCLTYPC